MKFPLLQTLKNIQTGLAPTLDELGLSAKLGTRNLVEDYDPVSQGLNPALHVSFTDMQGGFFSPIEIDLSKIAGRTGLDGLAGSIVRIFDWEEIRLGDSGWRVFENADYRHAVLSGDDEVILDTLTREIREAGVIPDATPASHISHCGRFAELYQAVSRSMGTFDDVKLDCSRRGSVESCDFKYDVDGSDWRVALEAKDAVLYIGEQRKSSCAARDAKMVRRMLYEEWVNYQPVKGPKTR